MMQESPQIFILFEAVGIGLLIGIERERNGGEQGAPAPAGVRTFALAAVIGALCQIVGGWALLAVALATMGGLRAAAHFSQQDRQAGLTTSLALMIVVVLGGLSVQQTFLAAASAVLVAALLAARTALRNFSRSVLNDFEVRDGLILGVATLVILPVLPDVGFGPGGAINPRTIALVVIMVMVIGAISHSCTRLFGARLGLPLSGFLAGFVSSTATIGAMARKVKERSDCTAAAAAGANLSSVSSMMQTGIVLALISPVLLAMAAPALVIPALVSLLYSALFVRRALQESAEPNWLDLQARVFSVKDAAKFALTVASVLLLSALLNARFGAEAVLASAMLAGLVSTSSGAIALASLVAAGELKADEAVLPLAAALGVNVAVRLVLALRSGEGRFGRIVAFGLVLTAMALGAGWWLATMGRAHIQI